MPDGTENARRARTVQVRGTTILEIVLPRMHLLTMPHLRSVLILTIASVLSVNESHVHLRFDNISETVGDRNVITTDYK